jgi:hypothetical protein
VASGDSLVSFLPHQAIPVATNAAVKRVRNGHTVIRFIDGAVKRAIFEDFLPRHYSGAGITLTLVWTGESDANGAHACAWRAAFERDLSTDLDADDFASAKNVSAAPPATSGVPLYTTLAFGNSEIDGLQAGEAFRLYIERVGNDAGDTLTAGADLIGVELRET